MENRVRHRSEQENDSLDEHVPERNWQKAKHRRLVAVTQDYKTDQPVHCLD